MQKNAVFAVGVSEGQWKCQDEIRSGDFTVRYSGGERVERGIAIVVHTSILRDVFKKSVSNDRIIDLTLKEEPVSILLVQARMPTSKHEDDEMEQCSDITEDILVEGGICEKITIKVRNWNSVVRDKSYQNNVGLH